MDKETLSHYGWIVIVSLVLAVMIALATPFGVFVGKAISNTVRGFAGTAQTKFDGSDFDADQFELDYNKDKQEWEASKASVRTGKVPDDGIYKRSGKVLDTFPDVPETGDTYEEGDYKYSYAITGWVASVDDKTKSSYGNLITSIAGEKLLSMEYCFQGCLNLKYSPKIPDSVVFMSYCFKGCINLREMPKLPNGLQTLSHTFQDCDSLAKFTPIPASVTNISYFMYNASNTPTSIEINCNPTTYEKAIDLTRITTIIGSCSETTKANILAIKS